MAVSEEKYTPVGMVHRERTRQGLVRGKSLGNLYSERYEYLDKAYDPYTAYIDGYEDWKRAEAKNKEIREEQSQMTDMMNNLFAQESHRYITMYPMVHHCSEAKAGKSLKSIGISDQSIGTDDTISSLDELMFRNYNMYKILAENESNKDFLSDIGCDIYDALDRENGMFDTKHEGILPSSKLYHEDENRQKLVLSRYDEQIRRLASTYGYNGYRAYLLDRFREVSDTIRSEGRMKPTPDEIKDLTVDKYGNIYYTTDDAKFMKEYDTALFDNAMTDDTKSRLNRENTRGFETDLESGFSEESQGFSME